MRIAAAHVRAGTLELLRHPAYSVPTLVFPTMFFLFFIAPRAGPTERANAFLASYAGFAVLGIAFFQFGVGIAAERETPWELFLRTLPVGAATRAVARVVSALQFSVGAVGVLAAAALGTTHAALSPARWLALALALLVGGAPFALLGIAIGYLASPRGALPIANVLYLGLSFAGGLWTGRNDLPRAVEAVSPYLPTRQFADVLWAAVGAAPLHAFHCLWLACYGVGFAALAGWAYRRDEGRRYR